MELEKHVVLKQQSRVILTALSQSHQPLINSQWRSSRVSGQRKLRCNSTRSPAPLKGNQTTEAPRLQLSSHLSPYAHRSHHVRRDNIECVRHLRAARRASLVHVFSCHVAYILFPILHFYPCAQWEADVSWFKSGHAQKAKWNQRDTVSPSSKQDFLHATILIDR